MTAIKMEGDWEQLERDKGHKREMPRTIPTVTCAQAIILLIQKQ